MVEHNELSEVTVTAFPKTPDGVAYIPVSASYRVHDCRSREELVASTTLTPAKEMQIIIPGSANKIVVSTARSEEKAVTVLTDSGLSTQQFSQYLYRIKNLKFVGDF